MTPPRICTTQVETPSISTGRQRDDRNRHDAAGCWPAFDYRSRRSSTDSGNGEWTASNRQRVYVCHCSTLDLDCVRCRGRCRLVDLHEVWSANLALTV